VSTCDRRLRREDAEGFTLIEVMVALGLVMLVMAVSLPAFLGMITSSVATKKDTTAKNLSQERIEQLRDLRFHIDRQNGPFLDLLDIYYTNAKSASPTTTLTIGGTSLTGQYVASAAAANGEPAGPFYRTTTGAINGQTGYTEVVDAQFLGPGGAVIPAGRFQDVYDSQVVGKDQPPSLMVGITVITRWTYGGATKQFVTQTRLTDGRTEAPIIQTQGRAVAVDVTSTAVNGSTLELQEGVASADGAQASGSNAAGYATGAIATQTGVAPVSGWLTQFNLPTQPLSSSGSTNAQSGPACSWYGFGRTGLSNVNGDISTGLPKAPTNVDAATPPNTLSGYVTDNSGGGCGLLSFDNLLGGGLGLTDATTLGHEMGLAPYVRIADTGSGSAAAVSGAAYVTSNALTTIPQKSKSGSAAFITRETTLFPNNPESGGRGLVSVTLSQASVDCASGSTGADGTVVGKYTLTLGWWGKGFGESVASWHTAAWTYDSSTGNPPSMSGATWDPTRTVLANGTTLSQLVTASLAPNPAVVNVGSSSGLRGFTSGILTLTTASTATNEAGPGYSAIKVQIGQLTCVADDQR
jgi:Tfp pilus assembly protein PilV